MRGWTGAPLKIVFAPTQSGWYLVGLIHSQWTI